MEGSSPPGGYNVKDLEAGRTKDAYINYSVLKAANVIISNETSKRYAKDGIISVSYIHSTGRVPLPPDRSSYLELEFLPFRFKHHKLSRWRC